MRRPFVVDDHATLCTVSSLSRFDVDFTAAPAYAVVWCSLSAVRPSLHDVRALCPDK